MSASISTQGQSDPAAGCPFAAPDFDPFEHFDLGPLERARGGDSVFYDERLGGFFVTRYDDCVRILGDRGDNVSASPALFGHLPVTPSEEAMKILTDSGFSMAPAVVDEDGELHKAHRATAQPQFTVKAVRELQDFISDLVTQKLDAVVERGAIDVVDDLVYDIPGSVILHMMGVPDEQLGMVKSFRGPWAVFVWGDPDDDVQIQTAQGMAQFGAWARGLTDRALVDDSTPDLVAEIVRNVRAAGDDPSEGDARAFVDSSVLNAVMAGHETTVNSLAGGILQLLSDRSQWEALVDDPGLIPNAVDEILRYCTGVPTWRQRITKELELPSGTTLPEGALVYCAINSANRDEAIFDDGERFDVRRENAGRHITFGKGAHTCMGNHLAKLEMRIILEEMTRRLPHMELVPDQEYETSPNTSQRGPEHIQVTWDPATNPVEADRS